MLRRPRGRFGGGLELGDVRTARRLRTSLRSSLRGVVAAPLVFALSVATMAAGMLMLSAYLLVLLNLRGVLASYGEDLSLVAFLPVKASAALHDPALEQELAGIDGIASVRWVSPAQALERMRRDLADDSGVLAGLDPNPLPASVELAVLPEARDAETLRGLRDRILAVGGGEEVRYGEAWVEAYGRMLRGLEWVGLGLGVCLLLVLGVIVSGTVRLAVHARADEIQIQRLVGADGFFVRLPLYLEAALQGALGAGLALVLLSGLHVLGLPLLGDLAGRLFGLQALVFFSSTQLALLVLLGTGLAVVAAMLSLLRLEEQP